MFNLKSFYKQCNRVWKLLRRPGKEEFWTVSKVSAIGLVLIGVIGFVIGLAMTFLKIG